MRKLACVVLVFAFAAIGCSSSESPTVASSPTSGAASPASPKINLHETKTFTTKTFVLPLEQDSFYFNPTIVKAPMSSTATVQLKNEATVEHNFSIDALHIDQDVPAGKTATVEVKLGTVSKYEFYCKYHKDSGMRGAFELS